MSNVAGGVRGGFGLILSSRCGEDNDMRAVGIAKLMPGQREDALRAQVSLTRRCAMADNVFTALIGVGQGSSSASSCGIKTSTESRITR